MHVRLHSHCWTLIVDKTSTDMASGIDKMILEKPQLGAPRSLLILRPPDSIQLTNCPNLSQIPNQS